MWYYIQKTGDLLREHNLIAHCYSGFGVGKNNPALQHVPDVGPLPCAVYIIGKPYDSKLRGPFCLPLTPKPGSQMFGRSAFLFHGDSKEHPGHASHGCIIGPRSTREFLWSTGERLVTVVAQRRDVDALFTYLSGR